MTTLPPTDKGDELDKKIDELLLFAAVQGALTVEDMRHGMYGAVNYGTFHSSMSKLIETEKKKAVQAFGEKVLEGRQWLAYDDSEGEPIDAVPVSVITLLMNGDVK